MLTFYPRENGEALLVSKKKIPEFPELPGSPPILPEPLLVHFLLLISL